MSLATLGRDLHKEKFFSAEDFMLPTLFTIVVSGIGFAPVLAVSAILAEAYEFIVLDCFDYFVNVNAHLCSPFLNRPNELKARITIAMISRVV